MPEPRIAILGAGLAGLGAASALRGTQATLYEGHPYAGGHASSHNWKGFVFDEGPHLSFTKNEHIRNLFASSVGGKFLEHPGLASNYFRGVSIKHPAQCHLYPLPTDIKEACLIDLLKARETPEHPLRNYKDWCYRNFGKSFSEIFVRRYTRKYWTKELEALTTDWVGPRIHAPAVEQVISGALEETEENFNYIMRFRYPKKGGFSSFLKGLQPTDIPVRYRHTLRKIDLKRKLLHFENGAMASYDYLVSSLPLPMLIDMIGDAPASIRRSAKALEWTSHFLVNVGVKGKLKEEAYWIYYYDEEIPFSRVSFPSKLSPGNAPPGHWSLQAEVVHSAKKPLGSHATAVKKTLAALKKTKLIERESDITLVEHQDIRYANVIFSHPRKRAVEAIHGYLARHKIFPCGRYGEWAYLWTDESYVSGQRAAHNVLDQMKRGRH